MDNFDFVETKLKVKHSLLVLNFFMPSSVGLVGEVKQMHNSMKTVFALKTFTSTSIPSVSVNINYFKMSSRKSGV